MKNILLAMWFICSASLAAGQESPVSFALYDVTLSDLVRVVLDDVAGASVVVSSDVVHDRKPFNFVVRDITPNQAVVQLGHVVKERGYELVKLDAVYHLRKASEVEQDVFVYLPKYRPVGYLADLIGGIIPRQSIANQRQLPGQQMPVGQAAAGQGQGRDTGVNSMIDKSDKDALVIKGTQVDLAMVKKLLLEVDRPIAEMLVKAVVMEVQTGAIEGSALNLLASLVSGGVQAGVNWNGGADVKNGVTFKVGGIDAIWSAINSDSRFKVISAPQIRVKSGASARFAVGSDTPVLGAVSYQGNGQSVQSVEYKSSGVILDLKPEIRGQLAELKIFQQLSSFAKTETGVNGSPTLLKRELSTSVVVGQNDVVLLGGLDEEKTFNDGAGIFFFPDWLRSKSSNTSRSEIVLMLYVERVQTPGESI